MKQYLLDLLSFFYPHYCAGCHTDVLEDDQLICAACSLQLPYTNFFMHKDNPVEQTFYGRVSIQEAGSACYFTKSSLLQRIIYELKYKGNKQAGEYLGILLGKQIMASGRFTDIDVIVPIPLNKRREKKRGYNQSLLIAGQVAALLHLPVNTGCIERQVFTDTQTHKGRVSRWENMEGVFTLKDTTMLEGKHILLIDDVLTTGATLESCSQALLSIKDIRISIATVACAAR
ncbi:MAG: ComF family protein [Filimonas sp.]|nr:ComF family protein [Filimonas sp.]